MLFPPAQAVGERATDKEREHKMKKSLLHRTVIVSVILLNRLFHGDSALADGCPAPSFAAARTFESGAGTWSLAADDFNGDGKPDLAVANHFCPNCTPPASSGSFSVLLGNGDGTFQSAVNYDAGTNPVSVAVGDFNGDGKPDLAVVNSGSTNLAVLLGKADGTFQSAVNYDTGTSPNSVAVGDFNGDGKLDLVVGGSTVSVLLGNGDGTFQAAVNSGTGGGSIAAADLNGDGKLDVTVVNGSGVSVLTGNGDGTLQAAVSYAAGTNPNSVAIGDFNNDGKPDLAVANNDSSAKNVSVLLGNANGTFQDAVNYSVAAGPYSVAVSDFNGDGRPDLAVATDVGITLLLGKGDGTFQLAVNYSAGSYPKFVTAGDFNGDG